jgi:UDP-GlcNAc3NAcA epimerase
VTIVGARPQFIKAAALSRAIDDAGRIRQILVHTGQHQDEAMSAVFFKELDIPSAAYELGVAGGTHAEMTGQMMVGAEQVLLKERPDAVLVFGDTNSTLAGALAAAKLNIPVAHVEAGLRSFNRRMPEETNRIVTDRVSAWLFCPTQAALDNVRNEGMAEHAHLVGDVMYDAALFYAARAEQRSRVMQQLGLARGSYVLATCHRAETTDSAAALAGIVDALAAIARDHVVIFPVHPRTRQALATHQLTERLGKVRTIEPMSFLDMVALERNARVIVTDSGGVQKEAFFYGVPCVTMREETEWVETLAQGRNRLAGSSPQRIQEAFVAALSHPPGSGSEPSPYGDGAAAQRIEACLAKGGDEPLGSSSQ